MKKILIATVFYFGFINLACTQDFSAYEKHFIVKNGDTLFYRLLKPLNYDAKKTYPIIYFLHGSGERGNDNEKQLVHGGDFFLQKKNRKRNPCFVVFPQCATNDKWTSIVMYNENDFDEKFSFDKNNPPTIAMELLDKLYDNILEKFKIDTTKVFVGGLSLGGMGTFEWVYRHPNRFARAFPMCGATDLATASAITKTKWWIFQGLKDDVVLPKYSMTMADALKQNGASVKTSYYPEANHNCWDSAFAERGLMKWIFK